MLESRFYLEEVKEAVFGSYADGTSRPFFLSSSISGIGILSLQI
jgi:hypothetical protein